MTAIKSQGRYGNGSGKEFVEEIMIDYWRPGANKWTRWRGRDGKQASVLIINIIIYYTYYRLDDRLDNNRLEKGQIKQLPPLIF